MEKEREFTSNFLRERRRRRERWWWFPKNCFM